MRLALGPLAAALDLEEALGDVVADAVAGDMLQRIGFGHIFGLGADDDGEFDFPVELGRAAGFSTSSLGPHRLLSAFMKTMGSDGIGMPDSAAWSA